MAAKVTSEQIVRGWGNGFWAGVIDVKSTITETAEEVAARIRKLLEFVPADRLGVTTDCGLILLQRPRSCALNSSSVAEPVGTPCRS